MVSKAFVIFAAAGHGPWRIGRLDEAQGAAALTDVPPVEDPNPAAVALAVSQAMRQAGYGGEGVVLALDSSMCYSATLPLDGLPTGGRWSQQERREAMLYRLEEQVPVAAEDLVADFIETASHDALGVCAVKADLVPLVEALESQSVAVASIVPKGLLAMQALGARHPRVGAAVLACNGRSDLMTLDPSCGKPNGWAVTPTAMPQLHLGLKLGELWSAPAECLLAVGLEEQTIGELGASGQWLSVQVETRSVEAAAVEAAAEILGGDAKPWVELRRDCLAAQDAYRFVRVPMAAAVVGLWLLLLTLTAAWLWRSHQYRGLADVYRAQAAEVFAGALPNQKPPPLLAGIRSRLDSEYKRSAGLRLASGQLPDQTSALSVLHRVLEAVPRNLRMRIMELRIEAGRVEIEGQVRTHGDADAVAAALRDKAKLSVEPSRTWQLRDKGVGFSLSVDLQKAASEQGVIPR